MLVVVLAVLLVGYVGNDWLMRWDERQQLEECMPVDAAQWDSCWAAHDRWPIEF